MPSRLIQSISSLPVGATVWFTLVASTKALGFPAKSACEVASHLGSNPVPFGPGTK